MRLLQLNANGGLTFTRNLTGDIPPYAILSHTWGADGEEVTFQDVLQNGGKSKPGYEKILFCGRQAKSDGLDHFWVDTCCIDKTSSAELAKAINSMFRWYRDAAECYVYLQDVSLAPVRGGQGLRPWDSQFRGSRWFTRGWTLQELLAPISVKFYSSEGDFLGTKLSLENAIHAVTNIEIPALRGDPLNEFPVLDRMYWSSDRQTTEAEDAAYCLLGIFGVHIAPLYGEGKTNAMNRLHKAIEERTGTPTFPSEDNHRQCTDKRSGANLQYVVAESHNKLRKHAEAEKMHREALELKTSVLGPEQPSTLDSMDTLVSVLSSQGKYEEAEEMHREALELYQSVLGMERPDKLSSMNNLANVLDNQGKYEEADSDTLASMNNLAIVLNSQEKYKEAEEMHQETLELRKSVLGAEHPSTLTSMHELAGVLDSQGKYTEAEEIHRDALELQTRVIGPSHPSTLRTNSNLKRLLAPKARNASGESFDDSGD